MPRPVSAVACITISAVTGTILSVFIAWSHSVPGADIVGDPRGLPCASDGLEIVGVEAGSDGEAEELRDRIGDR